MVRVLSDLSDGGCAQPSRGLCRDAVSLPAKQQQYNLGPSQSVSGSRDTGDPMALGSAGTCVLLQARGKTPVEPLSSPL